MGPTRPGESAAARRQTLTEAHSFISTGGVIPSCPSLVDQIAPEDELRARI
jgi:hypothetical protein